MEKNEGTSVCRNCNQYFEQENGFKVAYDDDAGFEHNIVLCSEQCAKHYYRNSGYVSIGNCICEECNNQEEGISSSLDRLCLLCGVSFQPDEGDPTSTCSDCIDKAKTGFGCLI